MEWLSVDGCHDFLCLTSRHGSKATSMCLLVFVVSFPFLVGLTPRISIRGAQEANGQCRFPQQSFLAPRFGRFLCVLSFTGTRPQPAEQAELKVGDPGPLGPSRLLAKPAQPTAGGTARFPKIRF